MEILQYNNHFNNNYIEECIKDTENYAVIECLTKKLEDELKRAKTKHLECGEVLLPNGLMKHIAQNIYQLADVELYGLKGCKIYINYESDNIKKHLSVINCDPTTPSTFELYLTLKQAQVGWNNFLPQFLKKMTRSGGTIVISWDYELEKKKLYRSYDDY